jgi:hypothetical protein
MSLTCLRQPCRKGLPNAFCCRRILRVSTHLSETLLRFLGRLVDVEVPYRTCVSLLSFVCSPCLLYLSVLSSTLSTIFRDTALGCTAASICRTKGWLECTQTQLERPRRRRVPDVAGGPLEGFRDFLRQQPVILPPPSSYFSRSLSLIQHASTAPGAS